MWSIDNKTYISSDKKITSNQPGILDTKLNFNRKGSLRLMTLLFTYPHMGILLKGYSCLNSAFFSLVVEF